MFLLKEQARKPERPRAEKEREVVLCMKKKPETKKASG